jgi:translocation and assembly module TamB
MNPNIRKALWIGGGAIGGVAMLLALLILFGNTGMGRRTIEWAVPKLTGGQVTLRGLDGRFPESLRVARLEVRDDKGLWLTADDVALDWAPLAYLWNTVSIENVTARQIDVLRRPVSEERSEGAAPHIEVDALKIDRLNVAAAVAWRAASVTLSGKLDYASLDDARIDIAAQRLDAPGLYRVTADISKEAISGHVDIREPANGLIGGLTDLPYLGPLSVQASASGPRNAQAIVLALTAGVLQANARGTVDLVGRTAQLDLAAQAPAMTPGPGLSWESLALEGHLRGSLEKPDIAAHLSIAQLKAGGGTAQTVKAVIAGQGGSARIAAGIDGLRLEGLPQDFFGTTPVTLQADMRFDVAELPVDFQLSHALATVKGHVALGGDPKGHATLDIRSLAPFAALAGLELEGSTHATATLDTKSGKTAATLEGVLNVTGGDATIAGLIGRNARFGFGGYIAGKDVSIEHASLEGAFVELSANGGLQDDTLAIDWTGGLRDLSHVADTLSGRLSLRGHVKGPKDDFEVTIAGDAEIAGGKSARGPVRIAARIGGLPDAPQGRVSADGRINGGALQFLADLEQRGGHALSIKVSKSDWKNLRMRADLLLARGADLPTGKVSLQEGQLADLQPFIGFDISGSLAASADLRAGKTMRLNLAAKALTAEGTHIENLSLDGTIADPSGNARTDLKLAAAGIAANGITGNLDAQVTGPSNALNAAIVSDLLDADGNKAHLTGAAQIDMIKQQVALSALDAEYRGEKAHLTSPAHFDLAKGIAVDRLHLTAAGAQADIAGRLSPSLDATASVTHVTSRLAKLFVPSLDVNGVLSADAKLAGTLAAPRGTISLHGTGLQLEGSASDIAKGELAATATLNGQSVAVDARLSAGKTLSLTVAGTAPLTPDGNINLAVKGNTDLALINPLLNAEGQNLRGTVALDGIVTGTPLLPRAEGTAILSEGDFQDYVQGIHVAGLSARIAAQGNRIAISEFKGRAGKGTVSADGNIDLWAPGTPVNLAINAKNARLLASNLMTVDGDATLKLTGQLGSHVNLIGTVRIDDGEVNLPETLPRNVAVLDVRRKGQKYAPPPKSKAPVIGLNVTVTSSGRLFVRGRGLEAEVSGRVRVEGSNVRPEVRGGFTMRRGEFAIAGQTLNFTSGRLGFDGASVSGSLDPSLNFVAESTSGSVTAKLEVTGYASAPKIKLSSTPYLPQDEVLAHLLFQQSVKQLGPLQLAQIAEGLGSLTGIGSGLNPLSRVRKGLGLDRLAVGGGQNGTGASVEAGRYVMNGVYVGAKQDTAGGTRAQVQVDLTRRLKAQATVNTGTSANVTGSAAQVDRGSSIGLTYQFDY